MGFGSKEMILNDLTITTSCIRMLLRHAAEMRGDKWVFSEHVPQKQTRVQDVLLLFVQKCSCIRGAPPCRRPWQRRDAVKGEKLS